MASLDKLTFGYFSFLESETATKIKNITQEVTEENVEDVSQELDQYLEEVDVLEPVDVVVTSVALENIISLGSTNENVTDAVVSIVDEVVGATDLKVLPQTTASILNSFEGQVDVIANSGMNYTQVEENIALQTLNLHSNAIESSLKFVVAENSTDTRVCTGNKCSENVAFSIALPESILKISKGKDVNISFVIYKTDKLFRVNGKNTTGTVLAATVYTKDALPSEFEDPVELIFTAPENLSSNEYKCAFWNETLNEFGNWSFEGCKLAGVSKNQQITCECTHLTNFAVLIFPNSNESSFLSIVTYIGCSMSIIGLIITIVTVLGSKSIRGRQPQQIMVNLCLSMLFLYIIFIFGVDTARQGSKGCIIVAVFLHYFLLTTIAWTAVEAANIYYLIIAVFNQPTSRFMKFSLALAWGLPWIPIIIMLSVDKDFYNNDKYCYINSTEKGALIGGIVVPVSVIIFGNCVVFGLVVRKIFKNTQGKIVDHSQKKEIRERFINAVAISCLLGLTWIFGFLSFDHDGQLVFLVLFCIFNTFQGVAIFVLFCFMRKECKDVWKAWFKKCRIRKPKFFQSLHTRSEYTGNSGGEMSNIGSSEFTQQTNASFNFDSNF
ncbi:adhesion G-protein coupled receptor G7-like [Anneissia japonica]|uniref:adhesion G-protein coupled receptor G7-like n=1 Tax=Anneissia japonica TaxID=1529436 RepID=UPI0014255C64|nr:adhesion G-protein coupled receptor G7-like [Anneissia japonica]